MSKNQITITWNGHSCFTVSADGYSIVFDPYSPGSVPGLEPLSLTADQILCSHEHGDHGYREAVRLNANPVQNPFEILKIDTFHDEQKGRLRGPNCIHILKANGMKVANLGDLGCSLSAEQMELLKKTDALLLPVGGYYTIDAVQARELVRQLTPRVVIPMHYRSDTFGYSVIGRLEEYLELCGDVVRYDTNFLVLDEKVGPQTAVLTLQ